MKAKKGNVTHKLKIAKGQLDGILQMIEEDRYCVDISNQLLATQALLKSANQQIYIKIQSFLSAPIRRTFYPIGNIGLLHHFFQ